MRYSVWDKAEKKFVNNIVVKHNGDLIIFEDVFGFNSDWDFIEDEERYVVSECSQHKDNTGQNIYEGDIVILNNNNDELYEVILQNSQWYITNENIMSPLCECTNDELSIIGNIYENPEMAVE